MTVASSALQFLLCFVGTASAGVLFNVPRRALVPCGFIGCLGWFAALGTQAMGLSEINAVFLAAFLLAVAAEIMARVMFMPAFCFIVPGIIPLVPGVTAYNAMLAYVMDQYEKGTTSTVRTLLLAGAISAGLVLAGSVFRALPQRKASASWEAGDQSSGSGIRRA